MTEPATNPAGAAEFVTIDLTSPIRRGDTEITQLQLRKPKTGEMRGLKVEDAFNTDVNTLYVLLPRISQPALIGPEIDQLDTEDLLEVAGAVKGFFMPAVLKAAMAKARGG